MTEHKNNIEHKQEVTLSTKGLRTGAHYLMGSC